MINERPMRIPPAAPPIDPRELLHRWVEMFGAAPPPATPYAVQRISADGFRFCRIGDDA